MPASAAPDDGDRITSVISKEVVSHAALRRLADENELLRAVLASEAFGREGKIHGVDPADFGSTLTRSLIRILSQTLALWVNLQIMGQAGESQVARRLGGARRARGCPRPSPPSCAAGSWGGSRPAPRRRLRAACSRRVRWASSAPARSWLAPRPSCSWCSRWARRQRWPGGWADRSCRAALARHLRGNACMDRLASFGPT